MNFYLIEMLPGDFRMETNIDLDSLLMKVISKIPILRYVIAKYMIKTNMVYARVLKVDPAGPEEFKLNGWVVRNRSERADGVFLTKGSGVFLGFQPILKDYKTGK
jgi:hypothetical protein